VMLGVGVAVGGFLSGLLLVTIGAQALLLVTGLFMLVVMGIAVFLHQKFA
jgi:predicted MFS family arabinose efflux permease